VAVFLAEVLDVRAGGFEDPQPEQTDEREVVSVRRVALVVRNGSRRRRARWLRGWWSQPSLLRRL